MQPSRKFTLIYDDYATGIHAKRFADMLGDATSDAAYTIAPWRCEMLEWEGIAVDVTRDAEQSEYVIFSLRGDDALSFLVKRWIESWLDGMARETAAIIALFDPARSIARHANGTRHYLRHVAGAAGIDFFGHWTAAPEPKMELSDVERSPAAALFPPLMTPAFAAA